MDPVLLCDDLGRRVARGSETRVPVTVLNPGEDEDAYRFEVLGDGSRWARVEPRHVPSVPGGDEAEVELVLRPPPDAPLGAVPMAVRCVSLRDAERCAVVEGDVVVAGDRAVDVSVARATGGRRTGRYVLDVANRGPSPATLRLAATDPRGELAVALAPAELTVDPGQDESAYLSVRPRRPRLAGGPVTHRFTVEHRGDSGPPARLPVVFEERPALGRVSGTVAALLVLLLVAAGGLLAWPTVRDRLAGTAPPATASGTPESSPPATAGEQLLDTWIVWSVTAVDDVAGRERLDAVLAQLQAAGVAARLVDSREVRQLAGRPVPAWVVVQDGFPDAATASSVCEAHRDIAPTCYVDGGG